MGGATPVLLKVLLFIKVGVATLKTLPRPILFLFQIALGMEENPIFFKTRVPVPTRVLG